MHLVINGQPREFAGLAAEATLEDLVSSLQLKGDRVAIEQNGLIVARSLWASTPVNSGDRMEIVHFVGGGVFAGTPSTGLGTKVSCARCRYPKLSSMLPAMALLFQTAWALPASAPLTADDITKPTFVVNGAGSGPDHDLHILVYGDMRFTDPRNTTDTSPRVRAWLAKKVADEKPDALLVTGDVPFHGSSSADWQIFRSEAASWWGEHLRVYPTVGNHEVIPDPVSGYVNYFAAFPQLHGYHVYSVLMGNVYVLSLNATEPIWPAGYQAEWLQAQLDHLPPQVDFVFFLIHVPLMADVQTEFIVNVPSPDFVKLRTYLESRAATSHAKFIVVSGHIHNYERFERNGITHVTSGGGGAKPYPIYLTGDEDLYRDNTASPDFNYVVFTIHGTHGDAKMYRVVDPEAAQLSVKLSDTFSVDARPKSAAQK